MPPGADEGWIQKLGLGRAAVALQVMSHEVVAVIAVVMASRCRCCTAGLGFCRRSSLCGRYFMSRGFRGEISVGGENAHWRAPSVWSCMAGVMHRRGQAEHWCWL